MQAFPKFKTQKLKVKNESKNTKSFSLLNCNFAFCLLNFNLFKVYNQAMKKGDFNNILYKLSLQKGEEKLRLAFKLNQFVIKLQKEGELYAKRQSVTS